MQNYRTLRVYQQARALTLAVYLATRDLPASERFGLTSQMRRASVSIVSNIAEGAGRGGKDFSRFLRMALGSAFELEAQLQLCNDLLLIGPSDVDSVVEQTNEVQRKRGALIGSIARRSRTNANNQELTTKN
ncbi:MAG: four helix bundle protein [Acidimicrobiia bacterium]|nr:four helix bundle protein [Acidimicrobiia bacterium]